MAAPTTALSFLLSDNEANALFLSIRVGLWCVALNLLPGIAVAWLLARRRFPGKAVLDAVIHLPLVIPPVVVGYLLLLLLGRGSAIGSWLDRMLGIQVAFTWKAAVLASAVMGFPLLVRAVRLSIEAVDPRLEQAARTLGASPFRVFMRITLALAWPGVITGALLCFARSLGEFGATITFAGNFPDRTQTLPSAIYTSLQTPGGDGPALRLAVISIAIALLALLISEWLVRRMRPRSEAAA